MPPEISDKLFGNKEVSFNIDEKTRLEVYLYSSPSNANYSRLAFCINRDDCLISENIVNRTPLEFKALRAIMAADPGLPVWLALRNRHGNFSAFLHQLEKLITISDLWGGISLENLKAILKLLKGE